MQVTQQQGDPPPCCAQERERRILESRKTVDAQRRVFAEQGHRALDAQPDYLKGVLAECGESFG